MFYEFCLLNLTDYCITLYLILFLIYFYSYSRRLKNDNNIKMSIFWILIFIVRFQILLKSVLLSLYLFFFLLIIYFSKLHYKVLANHTKKR